jgi:phage terminase large subunit-like protein
VSDIVSLLRQLPKEQVRAAIETLSPMEAEAVLTDWDLWARDKQRTPEGAWAIWLVMAGRGFGKGFSVKTPIVTPFGWAEIGELKIGDVVFDENGKQCQVTATFDYLPRKAYRLTFSDGTTMDACDEHQWVTWTHADRKSFYRSGQCNEDFPADWVNWSKRANGSVRGPTIKTTLQIVESFTQGKRGDLNHCIPTCRAIECKEKVFIIPPYVLGAWLGNGSIKDGMIHSGSPELRALLAEEWTDLSYPKNKPGTNGWSCYLRGLVPKLRELGVLGNKHLPKEYLRGSVSQRLALLQGFMDTDGYAEINSQVEYTSTLKHIAEAVLELARSLGEKPVISEGRATLNGEDYGPKWRVTWRATLQCFRLSYRAERLQFGGKQFLRSRHRMIVKFEEIEPVPMRCITVDSPNSMYLAGEGMIPTHNTRMGSEFIRQQVATGAKHIVLAGRTTADVRDTMVLGVSGIIACSPSWDMPDYKPSTRSLTWANGAKALLLSAEEPDLFRGVNCSVFWCDELAAWPYEEAWSNLMFGFRIGNPKGIVTTTPRRNALMKQLVERPDVHVTTGSTYENRDNLAAVFFDQIVTMYEGTRLGRQELHAEMLPDAGELWNRPDMIDAHRVQQAPAMRRVVVAIDPAVTSKSSSDESGIVVVGIGEDRHLYVLEDASGRFTPSQWAARALSAHDRWMADCIVAEVNNGGDLVEQNIRNSQHMRADGKPVRYKAVHASRGKATRAEPIVALYERGRVHHVGGLAQLEDQMVGWSPSQDRVSPDRVDALVWACTELSGDAIKAPSSYGGMIAGSRAF